MSLTNIVPINISVTPTPSGPLTLQEAIRLAENGDLTTLDQRRPMGMLLVDVMIQVINYVYGHVLDLVCTNSLALWRNSVTETDVEFRKRAIDYIIATQVPPSYVSIPLPHTSSINSHPGHLVWEDVTDWTFKEELLTNANLMGCDHTWANYHGLFEKYDYCTKCGEKTQTKG